MWFKRIERLAMVLVYELRRIGTRLDTLIVIAGEILKAVRAAQQNNKAVKLAGIHFQSQLGGEYNMPVQLPVGKTDKYFVIANDANGNPGALLDAGQKLNITSADAGVVLTPDPTPGIDPVTNKQSVASGTIAVAAGAVIGNPVNITAELTDTDGTTVIDTATDTVTPLVGTAKKIGSLSLEVSSS